MILINYGKDVQDLVLTLTELTTISDPVYLLVLTNIFTKTKTRYILQDNLSPNLERYDRFQLPTSEFDNLETGLYIYHIYQSDSINYDETQLGDWIEQGKAQVIRNSEALQPITFQPSEVEYLTYTPR